MNFRKLLTAATIITVSVIANAQEGVSIKSSLSPPDPSAMLDVASGNKGVLIPRIALSSVYNTGAVTISSPVEGLLVFNTNSAISYGFGKGLYYWTGTIWAKVGAGILPASTKDQTGTFQFQGDQGQLRFGTTDAAFSSAGVGSWLTQTSIPTTTDLNNLAVIYTQLLGDGSNGFQVISFPNSGNPYTTISSDHGMYIGTGTGTSLSFVPGGLGGGSPAGTVNGSKQWEFYGQTTVHANLIVTGTASASCGVLSCSDIRYKTNISPLTSSLASVMKMKGVTYNWKVKEFPDKKFNDKKQIGVIAQDLEKIYPELVATDEQGYKSVDYAKLTPVLVEAIKEQQAQIESLEQRVKELEKGNGKKITASKD